MSRFERVTQIIFSKTNDIPLFHERKRVFDHRHNNLTPNSTNNPTPSNTLGKGKGHDLVFDHRYNDLTPHPIPDTAPPNTLRKGS